jgi:glycosyltransferase involved in cell wall biosynthesis
LAISEPSISGRSRLLWVSDYIRLLISARRRTPRDGEIIVLWPVLGYYDLLLLAALGRRTIVIVHDPTPLARAVGYGRLPKRLATHFAKGVKLVVHSVPALSEVRGALPHAEVARLPHPTLAPTPTRRTGYPAAGRPIVTILGQYKPDRDLSIVSAIGQHLSSTLDLRIKGRGWPAVDGWDVDSRFISEREFDIALLESSVILVPYRRFYQSGVALRAIEMGTPVVGPRIDTLTEILGEDSPLLASDTVESWLKALQFGIEMNESEIAVLHASYATEVTRAWRSLESASPESGADE